MGCISIGGKAFGGNMAFKRLSSPTICVDGHGRDHYTPNQRSIARWGDLLAVGEKTGIVCSDNCLAPVVDSHFAEQVDSVLADCLGGNP